LVLVFLQTTENIHHLRIKIEKNIAPRNAFISFFRKELQETISSLKPPMHFFFFLNRLYLSSYFKYQRIKVIFLFKNDFQYKSALILQEWGAFLPHGNNKRAM